MGGQGGRRRSRLGLCAGWIVATTLAFGVSADDAPDGVRVRRIQIDSARMVRGDSPAVEVYFRALGADGVHMPGLDPGTMEIWDGPTRLLPERVQVRSLDETERRLDIVVGIDASRTMQGKPLAEVKAQLLRFLDPASRVLRPEDQVAVLTFAEDVLVRADFALLRVDTARQLQEADIEVERSQHALLLDGAAEALGLLRAAEDGAAASLVVLFADGGDGGSGTSPERVIADALGEGADASIPIFAVGYSRFGSRGMDNLRRIAEETGGRFWVVQSPTGLGTILEEIVAQIRTSYVARFPADPDGRPHRLRVAIGPVSQERVLSYPPSPPARWPWILGGATLLSALAALLVALWSRSAVGTLTVVAGGKVGTTHPVHRGRTRIGSLDDNDIVIPSPRASRYHAELLVSGRTVRLRDLRSKNGTRVNGQVVETALIRPGDRVLIADVELLYE